MIDCSSSRLRSVPISRGKERRRKERKGEKVEKERTNSVEKLTALRSRERKRKQKGKGEGEWHGEKPAQLGG